MWLTLANTQDDTNDGSKQLKIINQGSGMWAVTVNQDKCKLHAEIYDIVLKFNETFMCRGAMIPSPFPPPLLLLLLLLLVVVVLLLGDFAVSRIIRAHHHDQAMKLVYRIVIYRSISRLNHATVERYISEYGFTVVAVEMMVVERTRDQFFYLPTTGTGSLVQTCSTFFFFLIFFFLFFTFYINCNHMLF